MSHGKTRTKTKVARSQGRAKKPAKRGNAPSSFDPRRDQTGGGSRAAQTAQGNNDRRDHEGDRLAAALGPRLLCRRRAQEARLDADVGEGRRRTHLSCDCRKADQIEVESEHPCATGRLAMSRRNTRSDRAQARSHPVARTSRSCVSNGDGCTTVIRRGSVATSLSLDSATDFRKSSTAGSARRRVASCRTIAKALRTNGSGWPNAKPQPEARCASGSRMARPHSYRHGDGRWVRVRRDELSVADQDRQEDHRSALVGSALLWAARGSERNVRPMGGAMAEPEKTPRRSRQKGSLRDLHAKIVGGGPGAGVQLARRPARGLRGLHPVAEARRLDGVADAV